MTDNQITISVTPVNSFGNGYTVAVDYQTDFEILNDGRINIRVESHIDNAETAQPIMWDAVEEARNLAAMALTALVGNGDRK